METHENAEKDNTPFFKECVDYEAETVKHTEKKNVPRCTHREGAYRYSLLWCGEIATADGPGGNRHRMHFASASLIGQGPVYVLSFQ